MTTTTYLSLKMMGNSFSRRLLLQLAELRSLRWVSLWILSDIRLLQLLHKGQHSHLVSGKHLYQSLHTLCPRISVQLLGGGQDWLHVVIDIWMLILHLYMVSSKFHSCMKITDEIWRARCLYCFTYQIGQYFSGYQIDFFHRGGERELFYQFALKD